jgi:hypothetical protein
MDRQRRRIESELEARRCLSRVEAEDTQIGAWARSHGIDGRSLNMWRVNLARRGAAPNAARGRQPGTSVTATDVVELVPMAMPSAAVRYVLEIGGARLEIGDDFSEPTLRRLIGVLRSC